MIKSYRSWLVAGLALFFILNLVYWKSYPCLDSRHCKDNALDNTYEEELHGPPGGDATPPPPPPPPPHHEPVIPAGFPPAAPPASVNQQVAEKESQLTENQLVKMQPFSKPDTHYPKTHVSTNKNLDTIAPTADKTTYRLSPEGISYASKGQLWDFGVINSKPDVLIITQGFYNGISDHYDREFRIYSLMKWILRVHRRDPNRQVPLVMVDAGSNHGLFSMVSGASGAYTVAFEPQTHLRSIINMAGRLNQISKRLRVLPFAVLDKFKAMSMSKFDIYDGGIGALDYTVTDSAIHTQTIRLDTLPSFNLLFPSKEDTKKFNIPKGRLDDRSVLEPEDLGKEYATDIKKSLDGDGVGVKLSNALLWNQPIHFLKIDVEGFELPALKSAARLFEAGLVEHTVLEFGPPHRWDAIVENSEGKSTEEIRKQTMGMAKDILHRAVNEWDLDIYLLPAIGWSKTVEWMLDHGVDYSKGDAKKNKVVHKLKAWNFDQLAADHDEFEKELESKDNLVTEFIPLPDHLIDDYLEASEDIGEMYLWFAKRDSDSAVLEKQEL